MPTLNETNVRHLLRRTEVVDRPERVAQLLALPDMESAVDDVMNIATDPVPVSYADVADTNWRKGVRLAEHWIGQMATAARPFGERMAFFWHGHIVSSMLKSDFAGMHDQIDLFRRTGLGSPAAGGNFVTLLKTAAIQPAMIDYLDNGLNAARSPNQNFARELIELFVLGVGNYTEADVEAATAAWTGHGKTHWSENTYAFHPEHHESSPQVFLGRTVNAGAGSAAGNETIDVMLGSGSVGEGTIAVGPNAGRSAPRVAAEFLSRKLWQEFGEAVTGSVPSGVRDAMTDALVGSGFDIRPWVKAMLLHDDFYTDVVTSGLVRQPVEYMVALLSATGLPATEPGRTTVPFWAMESSGQVLLYPPNVSGWRPNDYWVNASAMSARTRMLQHCLWEVQRGTYDGTDGYLQFGDGAGRRLTRADIESMPVGELVDRFAACLQLTPSPPARQHVIDHLSDPTIEHWMRLDGLLLLLNAPELHVS